MILIAVIALAKKQDVYSALLEGGLDGLKLLLSIAPALVMLLTAVHMLRASGAVTLLTKWLSPASAFLGIPAQTLPLVLLRPFSGSAALAVGADLMGVYGADSLIGRTAAIMLGSTETTFYTISVYFGAAGIKKTRYAVPAALIADLTGFLMASLTAKIL
ncbi:MAG: spore maturation protein [Clostridiales bacterium]|nr:spore maturation protein [Clostridiales bacterium]